jgi:uncharacterized membrane protein
MSNRLSMPSIVLLASGVLAILAMLAPVPVPVRAVLVVGFALVSPGLAWVRLLDLHDRLVELTLGIALSIALGTLVASFQAYAGAWSPRASIVVLALLVAAAVVTESLARPMRGEAR